jgi:hypothetical protein
VPIVRPPPAPTAPPPSLSLEPAATQEANGMDRRRQPETVFFVLFSVPSFVPNTPFKSLLGKEVLVSRVPFGTSEIFSPTAPEESNFMFPKKKSTFS